MSVLLMGALLVGMVPPQAFAVRTAAPSPRPPILPLSADDIQTLRPTEARSAGTSRVETALEISRQTDTPFDAVVIATSLNYPDALAGAPLAHAADAPILLTGPAALDADVKARLLELKAAGATSAYLVGGTNALSPAVQSSVQSVFGQANTTRIGGKSRYETAALIAQRVASMTDVRGVVLASGESYPDALSAAGWAAASGRAILLTSKTSLPVATKEALSGLGVTAISEDVTPTADLTVVGGEAAVAPEVVADYAGVVRIGGKNRFETSALIAQYAWEGGVPSKSVALATGMNFPDALAAGPWCATEGAPLLLTSRDALSDPALDYLTRHSSTVGHVQAFGGTGAVSDAVLNAACEAATTKVSKKAPIATPETNALLSEITTDTLVFDDVNGQLDELQPGWVLRSNPTTEAPNGYFRKIVSVDRNWDGSVSYETTTAALTDVLLKGSVDVVMPAEYSDAPEPAAAGGRFSPAGIGGEASMGSSVAFSFGPKATFDGPSGSKITLSAQGSLAFKQSVVVSIVVDGRWKNGVLGIPYWEVYIAEYEQYLVYSGTFTVALGVNGSVSAFRIPVGPEIPVSAEPLITGFLVKPEVQLYLTGSVGINLSVSATLTISETKTGIRYRDGQDWTSFEERSGTSTPPQFKPAVKASGSIKIGIGAQVALSLCDFVGPYLDVTLLYGKASLTYSPTSASIAIGFSAGLSVAGGLKADIPIAGTNLARVQIFEQEIEFLKLSWSISVTDSEPPDGAAVSIDIMVDPPSGPPGTTFTYMYVVSNIGDTTLYDIEVSDDHLGYVGSVSTLSLGASAVLSKSATLYESTTTLASVTAHSGSAGGPLVSDSEDCAIIVDTGDEPTPTVGAIIRVSTDSGDNASEDVSESNAISADGRFVAFASRASNLVPGDSNAATDIFVKDTLMGTTTRVSTDSGGNEGDYSSWDPSISADGRFVAFVSFAHNLVPYDSNAAADIFVKDTLTGTMTRVSTDSGGVQSNYNSEDPSISGDGRFVAYSSYATNLVVGDTNHSEDVFISDALTGATIRVSTNSGGDQCNGTSYSPSLSADGRFVAFITDASNLVLGDTNGQWDVFMKDTLTGTTIRVSTDYEGNEGNWGSADPSVSGDGRFVAFRTGNNLVPGDTNGTYDIFVKDTLTGAISRVSVSSGGMEGNDISWSPSISGDGRFVAFVSRADNLVSGDANVAWDIFVTDTATGYTTRASAGSEGIEGNAESSAPAISSDGQSVAFVSHADNLVPGDVNNVSDVFVRRLHW